MRNIYIAISVCLATAALADAQNLDPTVEVSREYEGKLIEVHKPALTMSVPDTLHRFDLEFDYSVFESPYKGSYEFNPYLLEMKPTSSDSGRNSFYLNAGAGYTLHPELDLMWSPLKKGAFSMDIYATHRSYVGEYRGLYRESSWKGYDLMSRAGADFGYDWKKTALVFGASYYGIHDKDYRRTRGYNAVDAYAELKSKSIWPKQFVYDLSASYRFAEDNVAGGGYLSEHNFELDFSFGPSFNKENKLLFDLGLELDAYGADVTSNVGRFYFVPRYLYEKGILDLDLGVRISALIHSGAMFGTKSQYVYPDVHMNLDLIPDAMRFYVHLGGGEKINTYASLVEDNHHVGLDYARLGPLMDVTVERISAILGFEGRISSFFSYNLRGGYVNYKNALLDAVFMDSTWLPALAYSPYQKCVAALDWDLNVQAFRFMGSVEYTHAWGIQNSALISPSPLAGEVSMEYNWKKRIYAGVDCSFALKRSNSEGFTVPGYADLGVYAEYVLNRKFSIWLRGGNLLDMEIQRNLLYAEKGINFTAGICLNL